MTSTDKMTVVTFVVYSPDLEPEQISSRLGLTPTKAFRKGDVITTRRARYGQHPTGGWLLSSRNDVVGPDLAAHLEWVLSRIESSSEQIVALRDEGYDVALIVALEGSPGGGGPTLSEETLARIAKLRIPLDLDLYS